MTRDRLWKSYIEELKFYNPTLLSQTAEDMLASYENVSHFSDLTWIDLYDGPEVVGFILIVSGSHCPEDADYFIMEAYIQGTHRGKGIVYKAIDSIFKENPGKVGLYILNSNLVAFKFWYKVLKGHKDSIQQLETDGKYDDAYGKYHLWQVK